jgi:predicted RND superfamily exporter protein
MLNAAFGWIYDRLVGHRRLVQAVSAVVLAAASVGALGIGFDMSFRPLFADHDQNYQLTKKFERTFGQESGAHVVAIIENPNILTPGFLRQLDHLSREVARVPHVSEVISLATAPRLTWQDGRPTRGAPLPGAAR